MNTTFQLIRTRPNGIPGEFLGNEKSWNEWDAMIKENKFNNTTNDFFEVSGLKLKDAGCWECGCFGCNCGGENPFFC